MTDKKIIIGVEERVQRGGLLDNFVQAKTRLMKGLEDQATRTSRAVDGVTGGGGGQGRPGVAGASPQAAKQQATDQLRNLKAVGSGHADQAQKVIRGNRDIARSYEEATRAARGFNTQARDMGLPEAFERAAASGRPVPFSAQRAYREAMFGGEGGHIGGPPPLPGAGGGFGGAGGSGNWMGGRGAPPGFPPGGGGPGDEPKKDDLAETVKRAITLATVMNMGRQAAGVGSTVAGGIQSFKTAEIRNVAEAVQITQGRLQRQMMQGLSADMVFMGGKSGPGMRGSDGKTVAENVVDDYSGTKAGKVKAGFDLLGSALSGATQGAGKGLKGAAVGAGLGLVDGVTGTVVKGGSSGFALDALRTQMEGLDAQQASHPMLMAAIDRANGEKMMRAHGARQLMDQERAAQAYGFTLGEGIGIAGGIQRQTGMGATHDAHGNMRSTAMFTEGGLFQGVTGLMQRGIGEGAATGGVSGVYGALGGTTSGHAQATTRALEEAVARGTARGYADPRTSEVLVEAMGRASQGRVMEDASGMGTLVDFLTGGKGEKSVADAQTRVDAVAAFNAQSQNPFYQSMGLAQAKGILGPGAKAGAMQAAGGASLEDLMMGSQNLTDWGISASQRHQLAREKMVGVIASSAAGMGLDPARAINDPVQRRMALRGTKPYGTDKRAEEMSEMMGDFLKIDPQDAQGQKNFNKTYGGTGAKLVTMEETLADMVRALGDQKAAAASMAEYAAGFKAMMESQAKGEQQDILNNGTENSPYFVVVTNKPASQPAAAAAVPPAGRAGPGLGSIGTPGTAGAARGLL